MRPTSEQRILATKSVQEQVHASGIDLSKRNFLKVGGLAAVGTLTLGTSKCDKEDVDFYVSTVVGAIEELKPLLPNQSALLSKAISVAKSFNDAWQDDKFASATAIFENLVGTINEVIAAAGVIVSQEIKIVLTVVGIGLRAIAVLMNQQSQDPAVASAISTAAATPSGKRQVSLIQRMASPIEINALYEAAIP